MFPRQSRPAPCSNCSFEFQKKKAAFVFLLRINFYSISLRRVCPDTTRLLLGCTVPILKHGVDWHLPDVRSLSLEQFF